ncbi:phosphoglycerate mutase family protein [Onchocerca flexuosa]|uniref:Phosphoglycerate mutase family protein n=1 Tax=Onchocerca flexuosa TaxID=387005 RepID=A0A238BPS9_9BILA|nr:phosphoglycerate mutase family protein [Onchocerca flexuosa]
MEGTSDPGGVQTVVTQCKKDTTRRIFLIRNGEPADFGGLHNNGAFRNHNKLAKMDTAQAVVTVMRSGGFRRYVDDPPLSQIGRAGAELVGRSLSERSFRIHTIYTSPSLRCLQTAIAIMSTLNCREPLRLRIEPALYEPLSFIGKVPQFLNSRDLRANGYVCDEHYVPVMSVNDLKSSLRQERRSSDIQMRVEKAVKRILSERKQEGGILVISHASMLDVFYRIITNRTDMPRTMGDLQRLTNHYPRCSVTILQYNPVTEIWENRQDIVRPLTFWHASCAVNVPDFD